MEDPFALSVQTLERRISRGQLDSPPAELIEAFLMRSGRPVPQVLVLEDDAATVCHCIDGAGGAATGVTWSAMLKDAFQAYYPGGHCVLGEPTALGVPNSTFDGAWLGQHLSRFAKIDMSTALAAVHRALRPGGLLSAVLVPGEGEGLEQTPDGPVFQARWNEAEFRQALGAMDFDLLERHAQDDRQVTLFFRREY